MSSLDKAVKELTQVLTETRKNQTSPYDTQAEVIRVDGDTAWVHIPGGVDETPVKLTMNAQVGDTVQVRVSGGNAWLQGNATSPPTDDTRANQAIDTADSAIRSAIDASIASESAKKSAASAEESAAEAKRTTDEINAYAETAGKTVTQILDDGEKAGLAAQEAKADAQIAKDSASIAYDSAQSALTQLSMVEDVVGTLNWIAEHGIYVASTDTEVVDGKVYYTLVGTAITNPTGNPHRNGYYELISGKYVWSEDTEVDSQKTYYQVTAQQVAEPSGNPSTIPYYELEIDEAVVQYINTHLALTDRGLSVTDGSQSSMLISSDGVTIYGSTGQIVGQYGEGAIIGNTLGYHIEITTSDETQQGRLSFKNVNTEIAYMTNDELYIPRVVVVDSMQIGNWIWDAISSANHLTLKWKG